jgi:hypothetical protein
MTPVEFMARLLDGELFARSSRVRVDGAVLRQQWW